MKIVVLEDQQADRDVLLAFLEKYMNETDYNLSTLHCVKPDEIPQDLTSFEAVILDIMINGHAIGIEVARRLRENGFNGPIVFLTTSRDYYAEGFEVDAAHYLIKPYTYDEFREAMTRLIRQVGKPQRMVMLPVGKRQVKVVEEDILYIEVYGKETHVHTKDGEWKVMLPLREVEMLLSKRPFLRCFRSCIVNMEHISRFENNNFILDNDAHVPVTLRKREEIQGIYLDYRFEKMRRNTNE